MLEVMKMNKVSIETKLFIILYKVMFSVMSACPWTHNTTKHRNHLFYIFITTCNSSCGKVMFSQACVIPSVHRGRGSAKGSMHTWWSA